MCQYSFATNYKAKLHAHNSFEKHFRAKGSARKVFVKLIPWVNFINIFTHSSYSCRSQKQKNSVKSSVIFYTFGIYQSKSCSWNIGEIDTLSQFHQRSTYSFYTRRSRMQKKTVKSAVSLGVFGSYKCKSCS